MANVWLSNPARVTSYGMKYYVGGVNGVGKTLFLSKLKEQKPDYELIDGAKSFMEWLGFGDDYEKLRRLYPEIRDAKMAEFISQTLNNGRAETLVFAGHYLSLVRGEIGDVARDWMARFDGIVLITVGPEVLLSRIFNDNRDRALFKDGTTPEEAVKILKDYQLKENVEFLALADRYGIPSLLINNSNSDMNKVVTNFLDFDAKLRRSYL